MSLLPIVERELRLAARKRATYRARTGAAIVALVTAAVATSGSRLTAAQAGANLFHWLGLLAFVGCLLAGVWLTADCLSEEKREGTLGLLFLTDLKGHDVVFGKLAATSLSAFYRLLAVLPVLAFPLLLGGVTVGEFWRMGVALVNTLLLSLSVGMFVSAHCRREQTAMLLTGALMILLTTAASVSRGPWNLASPWAMFLLAFETPAGPHWGQFLGACLFAQGMSWSLLFWASWLTPRSWQEERQAGLRSHQRRDSELAGRFAARARALASNPVVWLAGRDTRRKGIWLSLLFATALLLLATRGFGQPYAAFLVIICLHPIIKFWIAWEAGRRFADDRRDGTLELLLSTPLSVTEILQGQVASLRRQFRGPVLAVLVLDALLIGYAVVSAKWAGRAEFVIVMAAVMGMLLAEGNAVAWLGLWLGLQSKKSGRAALSTVLRVVALPTAIFILLLGGMNLGTGWLAPSTFTTLAMAWLLVCGFNGMSFGDKSRRQLQEQFRRLANNDPADVPKPRPPPVEFTEDYAFLR